MKVEIGSIYDIADFSERRMHEAYRVPKTFFCIFPLKEDYHYYIWYGGRQEYTLRKGYYVIPVVLVPKRWFCGDFVILYCSNEDEESAYICEKYKYYKGVSRQFLGEIGGHKYADATQYELYDNVNEAIDRATELEREDKERERVNKEEKKRLRALAKEEKRKKKEAAEYKEYLRLKEKYER
jgi:hypothetical protein